MSREEHHRRLEHMYHGAACNEYYAPRITIGDGVCDLVVPVLPKLFHPAGAVHGSVYFKALDDASFFAANSLVEGVLLLTASFHITMMRPVSSGEIQAHGHVVHAASQMLFADAEARDSSGRVVARGSGTFVRSRIELTPELGYRLPD